MSNGHYEIMFPCIREHNLCGVWKVTGMIEKVNRNKTVIGRKQTLRALSKNEADVVYISKDADPHVTDDIVEACREQDVRVEYFDNMRELGRACGIDVNAAAAAVLK